MVEPVARAARPDQLLELIGLQAGRRRITQNKLQDEGGVWGYDLQYLDPDKLIHALVAPYLEALSTQLHGSAYK